MAEWSKALRSGRSPLLRAWVRIPLLTKSLFSVSRKRQQSGAVEACWAHNPEVGRSKLPSARYFLSYIFFPSLGQFEQIILVNIGSH
jgi:hypothetical protein